MSSPGLQPGVKNCTAPTLQGLNLGKIKLNSIFISLFNLIDELHDEFYQHTFENGVKWLNEKAAKDFLKIYPDLVKAIGNVCAERAKFD